MAWWDSRRQSRQAPASLPSASLDDGLLAAARPSPRLRKRFSAGDAFPRLDSINTTTTQRHTTLDMDERAVLSPVAEENAESSRSPALVIQVEIFFTDPLIRSRYARSYASSPTFEANNRICRGLVRRIERCSEELITRKDSSALTDFSDESHEPKPSRFELTFRILKRGRGEWAERTYRSHQKQPLTVGHTKEIISATHRIVGLYLRRHDPDFRWLDHPVTDQEAEEDQVADPSREAPLSLLCIPNPRFIESTQTPEFVSGYKIELTFQSRNPQRRVPVVRKSITLDSKQDAPLTLFMSEDLLWKGVQAINTALDAKKREFDHHFSRQQDGQHSCQGALEIELRISNNLGPLHDNIHRDIKSSLLLFFDPEARDCTAFLDNIEGILTATRDEIDAKVNDMDDFVFRIRELKGANWKLKDPARFKLGSKSSCGRRTIQAVLDRIQTGVGDIIRGHNISIHIDAHKRGHLVLDKAIVAHEKRGRTKENFASPSEEEATFLSRLKARIQQDIDRVLEDTCAIDDIPDIDEEEVFIRPFTPARQSAPVPTLASAKSSSSLRPSTPLPPLVPAKSSSSLRSLVSLRSLASGRSFAPTQPPTPRQSPSPVRFERAPSDVSVGEQHSPERMPSSPAPLNPPPTKMARPISIPVQPTPQPSPAKRPLVQRIFSLSRRSSESVKVVDHLKPKLSNDPFVANSSSQPSTPASSAVSDRSSQSAAGENSTVEDQATPTAAAKTKPSKRPFSLFRRRSRANDVSTLAKGIEKIKQSGRSRAAPAEPSKATPLEVLSESPEPGPKTSGDVLGVMMTSSEVDESAATRPAGSVPVAEAPITSSQNDDRNEAASRSAAREPTKAKMDTPEAFEDAREFAISPAIEPIVKSETSSSFLTGDVSPRFDEYSTAPSTPDLSLGSKDSSPRHSLLTTPIYVRTSSGTNDIAVRKFDPEVGAEVDDSDITVSKTELPAPLAAEELPSKHIALEASVRDDEKEGEPDQRVAQPGQTQGPGFTMSEPVEPQPTTSAPTPLTTKAPSNNSNANSTNSSSTAEKDFGYENLGAEKTAGSEGSIPRRPDFPTKRLRDPAPTPNHDSPKASENLDARKTSSQNVDQATGNQVGPARGAEGQPVAHKDKSNVTEAGPDGHRAQADGANPGAVHKVSPDTGSTRAPSAVTGSEEKGTGQAAEENGPAESQNSSIPDDVGSDKHADGSNIEFEFPEGDVRDELRERYGTQAQAEMRSKRLGSNIEFEFPDAGVKEHLDERRGSRQEPEKVRKGSEIDFEHSEATVDEYLARDRGSGVKHDDSVATNGAAPEKIGASSEPAPCPGKVSDIPEKTAVKSSEPADLPTGADIEKPGPTRLFADVEVAIHHVVPEKRTKDSDIPIPEKRVRLSVSETAVVGDVLAAEPASLPAAAGDVETEKSSTVPTDSQDVEAAAEEQLAAELEVQANDNVKDVSPPVTDNTIEAEPVKEPIVPEVAKELAEEFEVQVSPEGLSSEEVKKAETRTETATAPQDITRSATDLGRKDEPEPERSGAEEQHPPVVTPPVISVKEFDTTTTTTETESPSHPVATPDISLLNPNPRHSTSTFSSGYTTLSDTSSFISRGSVDTFRPSFDESSTPFGDEVRVAHLDSPHDHEHTHPTSRPQTAGYLGLNTLRTESRFIELGLRGALGDQSKRLSLPLNQHCFFDHPLPHHLGAEEAETGSIAGSTKSGKLRKKDRHRKVKSAKIFSQHAEGEDKAGEKGGVKDGPDAAAIPKMMMLFAGAVALGKFFRGGQ
ncbi:uncharacterized protein PODANS_1_7800 [Podospora anserina S mat+]|uniref:Podospora anserina S mat+ genomic DNA chromosome 1, supercontig 1 n=1 Tax=Podospora anserina (strain S / ATCC MYA-4624 / DSM 980 / FGSC 10383) TaxID=515849 RepID=B2A8Y3_PODAN|nr:uncharacterized protein PODANS_1_7800 [Podospora anserina S mat+]CAP60484.1 unnamed protein product [Podospora anserina S mat+]CDP23129.1 Putative protein of unknown function [Podospora anserina S mat+]